MCYLYFCKVHSDIQQETNQLEETRVSVIILLLKVTPQCLLSAQQKTM